MTNDDTPLAAPTGSPLPSPAPVFAPPAVPYGSPEPARLPPALARLLHHDGTAVAMLGLDGTIHDLSRPMLDLIGAASVVEVSAGSAPDAVLRSFLDHVPSEMFRGGDHVWRGRVDHRDAAGRQMVFRATVSTRHDSNEPGEGDLSLVLHDVTEPDEQIRTLVHRATHDPLTGLATRHQLLARLSQAIAAQRGRSGHVAAIFLDLDHLAYVNEAFGHAAGDRLLVSSARRLEQVIRPVDDIARIGGDEFLAIASGIADAQAAVGLAERARRALSGHLRIGELDMEFSVSAGIAVTDADILELVDADAASTLISNADAAMSQSKRDGRDRCTLYTTQMRSTARERTDMAQALSLAINDGGLAVHYQPIHSAMSGAPVAAEALVRWTDPGFGTVDALTIIETAERAGSIGRLGEFVLGHALADLSQWRASGIVDPAFAVHVNVSRVQLASSSFVNGVVDRLHDHRLEPGQLVLEARESPMLGHESDVIRTIRGLRHAGVQIAVDNFGTGSKALSVLTDVGVDVLKLDGSLALPSGFSEADTRLVRAVVLLAHALDIDVVAERVHGQAQMRRLQAAGCDMLQGHLLGRPADAASLDLSTSSIV